MRVPSEMPEPLRESNDSALGNSVNESLNSRQRRLWRWSLLPWVLVVLAIVGILVVHRTRHFMPLLTQEELTQARARWKAAGISDYELRLESRATELGSSAIHVVVEHGKVTELEINGEAGRSNEPSLYTVDGLLEVLQMELNESRPATQADTPRSRSIVRAQFDPQTGVPLRALRLSPGSNRSMEWQVMQWKKLEAPHIASSAASS